MLSGNTEARSNLPASSKGQIKMPRPTLPRYLAKVPCHGGTLKVPRPPPTVAAKVQGMVVGGDLLSGRGSKVGW
jgi:hypothetical protein